MFRKELVVFLLVSLGAGLVGCKKNCGPSDEPRLNLYINMEATLKLTEVYGLNTVPGSPAVTLPQSTTAPNRVFWQLNLPLNLNADKTQYVFVRSGRRDTVTVQYRRVYAYEDTECGYTITLLRPLTSGGATVADSLIVQTTTGKLNFVEVRRTTTRTLMSRETNTGISAGLLWL